jgi:EamA domain-containing membrane protein RarD
MFLKKSYKKMDKVEILNKIIETRKNILNYFLMKLMILLQWLMFMGGPHQDMRLDRN